MSRRSAIFSLMVVPLLVLLVACGGDKKDDSSSNNNGGSNSSNSSGSSSSSGSTGSGSTGATSSNDGAFSIENCRQYAALEAAAAASFGSPNSFKVDQKALDNLVKATPSEIRSDMQLVVATIVEVFSGFEKLGLNFNDPSSFARMDQTKIAELEKLTAKFDDKKFTDASDRIERFFESRCS